MPLPDSHQGGWKREPASVSAASSTANAIARDVQRLAAAVSSIAKAAFMHSSQRKGSCTNRNSGRCSQSKLLAENIRNTLPAPQAESSIQRLLPETAPAALCGTG